MSWELEKRTAQRAAGDSCWSRFMLAFGLRVLLITESPTCVSTEVPVLGPPASGKAHRDVGPAAVNIPVFEEVLQGNVLLKHIRQCRCP